jgi:DNA topoisomerase-1
MAPDELTLEKAEELLSAPSGDRTLGTHPEWGTEIAAKIIKTTCTFLTRI